MRVRLSLILVLLLSACATTPTKFTDLLMKPYDQDTKYVVVPKLDGFDVAINFSRYQFVPESDALAVACKSILTNLAYEEADRQGRKINPLNEQRIRISMGRDGFSGITSCSALAMAEWKK